MVTLQPTWHTIDSGSLSRTPAVVRPRTDERPCRFSVSLFNTTNHKIPGSEEVIISREYRIVFKIWMDNSLYYVYYGESPRMHQNGAHSALLLEPDDVSDPLTFK